MIYNFFTRYYKTMAYIPSMPVSRPYSIKVYMSKCPSLAHQHSTQSWRTDYMMELLWHTTSVGCQSRKLACMQGSVRCKGHTWCGKWGRT